MSELPTLLKNIYASNKANLSDYALSSTNMVTLGGAGSISSVERRLDLTRPAPSQEKVMADQLRVVKVFIADTNENIPVGKRLIYTGEETVTELTDQELFFEIDIKKLLDDHNKYRITVKDKDESSKDNTVYLEPVRIKDLKMTVVDIATF